jgi:hypothetical protein
MELKAYLFFDGIESISFFDGIESISTHVIHEDQATPDSDVEDADCWGWRHIGGPMVGCRLRVDLVR